jgi:transcription antitermination factor NusG
MDLNALPIDLTEPFDPPLPPLAGPSCDWTSLRWHIVRVISGRETEVVAALRERGVEAWSPVRRVWAKPRNRSIRVQRWRQREYPLAPGYVLMGLTTAQEAVGGRSWWVGQIGFANPVRDVTGFIDVPAGLSTTRFASQVTALADRVMAGEFDEDKRPRRRRNSLRRGDRVRVQLPTGDSAIGTVVRSKPTALDVLVELLGASSSLAVRVPLDKLEVVE